MASKRLSFCLHDSPIASVSPRPLEAEDWTKDWSAMLGRDVIDSRVVSLSADESVEAACELLLAENIQVLAVKDAAGITTGLFDFADVNAFLVLAATRHTFSPEYLKENPQVAAIEAAARLGSVSVSLVSNLSEKNPLRTLPNDATLIDVLEVFAGGAHRVLIESPNPEDPFIGFISDRGLLQWLSDYAERTPTFQQYLTGSLDGLNLPSINIHADVVSCASSGTILDAMKAMSEQGVGSVAVVDEVHGTLLSAVSVTDVGKIVVPATSNQILAMLLTQFVRLIKAPDGNTDGIDKIPVFAVSPVIPVSLAIHKLLATNAHRLFVATTPDQGADLTGIISVVDILSLVAHLAGVPNIDPQRMQRHRRASSSTGSGSSRSSSRASVRRLALGGASSRHNSISMSPSHQAVFMPLPQSPTQGHRPSLPPVEFEWAVKN